MALNDNINCQLSHLNAHLSIISLFIAIKFCIYKAYASLGQLEKGITRQRSKSSTSTWISFPAAWAYAARLIGLLKIACYIPHPSPSPLYSHSCPLPSFPSLPILWQPSSSFALSPRSRLPFRSPPFILSLSCL